MLGSGEHDGVDAEILDARLVGGANVYAVGFARYDAHGQAGVFGYHGVDALEHGSAAGDDYGAHVAESESGVAHLIGDISDDFAGASEDIVSSVARLDAVDGHRVGSGTERVLYVLFDAFSHLFANAERRDVEAEVSSAEGYGVEVFQCSLAVD